MTRLFTGLLLASSGVAAVFLLPSAGFFLLATFLVEWAALEFVQLVRPSAPQAPLRLILVFVPVAAWGLAQLFVARAAQPPADLVIQLTLVALGVGTGTLVLLSRTPIGEVLPALATFCFGTPYFALGIASIHRLQQVDPWLVFLLLAITGLGDTAGLYVGTAFGRHRFAPVVSPKKSWEGAIASFLTALVAIVVWSHFRLGRFEGALLAVGVATAISGQLGDLVESLLKRGVGVKDSGGMLPGHGGMFDRLDALLFAAPVMLLGLMLVGIEIALP